MFLVMGITGKVGGATAEHLLKPLRQHFGGLAFAVEIAGADRGGNARPRRNIRDRQAALLFRRRESSLSSSEGAQPPLRPLHLVGRETEFCGQRLAGDFRRRMCSWREINDIGHSTKSWRWR